MGADAVQTPTQGVFLCEWCGRPLPELKGRRSRQRFCSAACRAKGWRRREAVETIGATDAAVQCLERVEIQVREARRYLQHLRERRGGA